MDYRYTVERLKEDRERFRGDKEFYKNILLEFKNMFDRLLSEDSTDEERVKIANKLEEKLTHNHSVISHVAVFSKIANETTEEQLKREKAHRIAMKEHEEKCRLEREEFERVEASGESVCNVCNRKIYNAWMKIHMKNIHGINIERSEK